MVNSADTRLKAGLKLPSDVPDPVIVVNNLTKDYVSGAGTVRALDHISIGIARGRFTAIMGPSGSGKSTFMHCLAGFESATSGSIKIDDTEIVGMNQRRLTRLRRDHIGFIFQAFNLIPTLSAKENILLPFEIARRKVPQDRFEQVVAALGLEDRLKHRPSELSGGQQQRVACARALMQDAVVLFADEPTGNLDSESSKQVLRYLRKAVNDFGQSVVMVTHEAAAAAYADRVLFLLDGKIVAELDHPEREKVLAAQTELPHFVATSPLPGEKESLRHPENSSEASKDFLPTGSKPGAWPDREKMQARLANLQLARGAQIEVPSRPTGSAQAGNIDAGALNALMGVGKPVVPAELRTKEGARRALAQTQKSVASQDKATPQVEPAAPSNEPKPSDPGTSKEPSTRLKGSVLETRDERGTTWQGWTPKPGQQTEKANNPRPRLSTKTASLPESYRLKYPGAPAKYKSTGSDSGSSNQTGKNAEKSSVPEKKNTAQSRNPEATPPPAGSPRNIPGKKDDNERWAGLYSVFSNPVAETTGFWEDTATAPAPAGTSRAGETKPAGKNDAQSKDALTEAKNIHRKHPASTSLSKEGTSAANSKESAGQGRQRTEDSPSASVPRTPEETLSQEKQRLLDMIKKAEALLDSSQDAIASFEAPQDKA